MIYVDPTETIEKLRAMKAKRILLQLPDGLKPRVFEYFNALSREFNVIVSSEKRRLWEAVWQSHHFFSCFQFHLYLFSEGDLQI